MDDFWVFGYGSLMWNPGFPFQERQQARLYGYRRSLCIRSNVYRGTDENPGLVLGLERGGSCHGVAFRVADADREAVLEYLRERELVSNVYKERVISVGLMDGRRQPAMTYVADPDHPQYIGGLALEEAAKIVRHASGRSGPNVDYVFNTVQHLQDMGIRDAVLEQIAANVEAQPAVLP
ncbi:gamma-glutamylcyclotransferase [Agrobacterium rubi]|nr:gamma-glutamylcyclotransferase [Agrobacterium rubi]MBP1880949.1 cation transport protein ChaC [Agrobacterium rubi]NTE88443.1 gamma-glutamylcyclotransferase [Agrobacterium rubi]NTF04209.1 gamma-glutamylcyclotransferase [Agrobacterium rubi]NTF38540.1 gamma-glutamylcyclotransferase [Agrobacterium rubi]OCJ47198.1 gamma-glutamylcyclotransferase [Agrobacterium rubi]